VNENANGIVLIVNDVGGRDSGTVKKNENENESGIDPVVNDVGQQDSGTVNQTSPSCAHA
jgi:hypothetical protein